MEYPISLKQEFMTLNSSFTDRLKAINKDNDGKNENENALKIVLRAELEIARRNGKRRTKKNTGKWGFRLRRMEMCRSHVILFFIALKIFPTRNLILFHGHW